MNKRNSVCTQPISRSTSTQTGGENDMHKLTPQDKGKRLAGKNVSKMSYFVSNGMKNLNSFNQSSIN